MRIENRGLRIEDWG